MEGPSLVLLQLEPQRLILRRFVVLQFELQRFVVEKLGPPQFELPQFERPIPQRFVVLQLEPHTAGTSMRWKQALKIPQGLMNMNSTTGFGGRKGQYHSHALTCSLRIEMKLALQNIPAAFPFCVLAAILLSTNLLFPWNNRLNGNK